MTAAAAAAAVPGSLATTPNFYAIEPHNKPQEMAAFGFKKY